MRQTSTTQRAIKAVSAFTSQMIGSKPSRVSGKFTSPKVGWYMIFHIIPATISETMSGIIRMEIQRVLRPA